jgi:hypothetical protein
VHTQENCLLTLSVDSKLDRRPILSGVQATRKEVPGSVAQKKRWRFRALNPLFLRCASPRCIKILGLFSILTRFALYYPSRVRLRKTAPVPCRPTRRGNHRTKEKGILCRTRMTKSLPKTERLACGFYYSQFCLGRSDRFRIFPAFTSRLVDSPDLQSMRGEGTETVQPIRKRRSVWICSRLKPARSA